MLGFLEINKRKDLNGLRESHISGQFAEVQTRREYFNNAQGFMAQMGGDALQANQSARIPQDVYREFDSQATAIMRADNLTLMNDLMALAKSLPIGKALHEYRQSSDAGSSTTSMNGQVPAKLDKTAYTYDGAIVPIHAVGYGREWREWSAQQSEGFDGLIDDNENATRKLKDTIVDAIYDGSDVTFKGVDGYGIKNAANTQLSDLGAGGLNIDFTDASETAENIRNAFIQLMYVLRTGNNVTNDLTVYISREIEENFQRYYSSEDLAFGTLLENLNRIAGIKDIKTDAKLSGNELLFVALESRFIQPLVGMAASTVPVVRSQPFDNYNFLCWSACGLQIRADATGKSGVLYAREA
jgi:hypothetical protein